MDREDFNKVKSPMTKTIIRMLAGKNNLEPTAFISGSHNSRYVSTNNHK